MILIGNLAGYNVRVTASRRQFLAGAASAAVAASFGPEVSAATSPLPAPDSSGIDHVVVVMMENRSFDHFLGWLPGANGKQAGLTYVDSSGVAHKTYHLDDFQGCAHPDPDHSFEGGRVEYNDGKCDGWLRAGSNDVFSIGYYLQQDLPFYGQATPYWTVCDNYFSAIMAETYPNRFYQHSAQTDRIHNSTTISTLPTIWDRLAAAGLQGRYYFYDVPFTALWGTKYQSISRPYTEFLSDCAAGTLPQVSFVDPKFLDEDTGSSADDHPHADIRAGQSFLDQVYRAVTSSPAWERTLLVINYDEWGGFFDHVPPAVAPDANPDWGLRGFRVPCLVISPRARRNYVAHNVYDHTSILKTVEWRWNLSPLTVRDAGARNLAEVLDFTNPPNLTAPQWPVPQVVGSPCAISQYTDYEQWVALKTLAQDNGWTLS
ncbi:alkaline phosphatase family protein [Amycolatopsis sp. K13G38]|uniref:phospholipase C n=1 Tax=Amycolatopsis acididurans TaxID=2724524 RepID=A0ABX1JJV9_9PSEU|nr:alkaline phosphatase family protein [Amycolatopsis acididurans]NKQ58537.1 alkaline phosphatase family protein [Amycolatopsis acididurans]